MKFSVSVVIPNYNGRTLLEENLPSVIAALKFSLGDYEMKAKVRTSKENFSALQPQKSIEQIVNEIRKNVSGFEKELF